MATPLVTARVWADAGFGQAPEQRPGVLRESPAPTAVCLSGGGTRSMVASIGQLRALQAFGVLDRVGYLSCVSGGAWAVAPFVFSPDGLARLGTPTPPDALTRGALDTVPADSLLHPATVRFKEIFGGLDADPEVAPSDVWIRAVGQTFLAPADLHDSGHSVGCALGVDVGELDVPRYRARAGAPFPVIHAAVNWPERRSEQQHRVPFEQTPLYAGVAQRRRLRGPGGEERVIGGTLVEAAAIGCFAPEGSVGQDGRVAVRPAARPWSLASMLGATSAFNTPDRDERAYPHVRTWTLPGADGGPDTADDLVTDGGDVDTLSLLGMLRRGVKNLVVCLNSVWPVDLEHDPAHWPEPGQIDPALPPLFGQASPRWPHNQVFARSVYVELVRGLQQARRDGRALVVSTRAPLVDNPWWGIEGGGEVSLVWVYNSRVPEWEGALPVDVRRLLPVGDEDGPLARFPHYRTVGQNPGALTRLTPLQANLLCELAAWTVLSAEESIRAVLA